MKQPGAARRSCGAAAIGAVALLALVPSTLAATAVGHVSVTILPAAASAGASPMIFGGVGAGGTSGAGSVTLTGPPGTPVTLSLSGGDVARGPGRAIPFRVVAGAPGPLVLDRSGVLGLALGATLSLGRDQALGAYHGAYAVTVDY